jgi:hypothetical protein
MALILQLSPDLEERLAAEARDRGVSLDDYVRTLLEHRFVREPERKMTQEEFEAILDSLAEFSDKIPDLPAEAFTREGIYRDHD